MRLEQLVLFGPGDNASLHFGPRVTVLAGLDEHERRQMVHTLVDAMAGRLPNASVIFVDQAGRRVFADRMGATYADNGVPAPSLGDVLGTDPGVISDLVVLNAAEVGLGTQRAEPDVAAELTAARAAEEQLRAELSEVTALLVTIESWELDLARIDEQIEQAPEAGARWAWIELRNELDQLRAERAALEHGDTDGDDADAHLLSAVDELRTVGEAWAEATTAATELAQELGPLPPVSDADLALVAATPPGLPDDFDARVAAVSARAAVRAAAEAELASASEPATDPGDGIVYRLAQLNQARLWEAHEAAIHAQQAYESELGLADDRIEPAEELEIEAAHEEVVRAQSELQRRFRPGMLGAATLAVGALLAGETISIVVGALLLAGSAAMAWWLLLVPRRAVAAATAAEHAALAGTDAGTWLGLHLRRVDDFTRKPDRGGLSAAATLRASTRHAWEDLSGRTSIEAATERREAVRAYAQAIDPAARAERQSAASAALAEACRDEAAARTALTTGLQGFGLSDGGAADLDATQIRMVLEQRAAAGEFARQVLELQHQQAMATSTGAMLDRLMRDLGFDDGDLASRLERAIVSVDAARRRRLASTDVRTIAELDAAISRLSTKVESGRRLSWDLSPEPAEAPTDPDTLVALRRDRSSQIAGARRPNVGSVERRLALATERVGALETELATIAEGPTSVRRRLADRIARTTWFGPNEESLPIVMDDALVGAEPAELFKLLDMVVRLSERTQVVVLTGDPTVATWARREAKPGVVTLLESDGAIIV